MRRPAGALDRAAMLWPASVRVKVERLWVVLGLGDLDGAQMLIQDPSTRSPFIAATQVSLWRVALAARRSHDAVAMRAAAGEVRRAQGGRMALQDAFGLCSLLDDLDCAFAAADRFYAGSDETSYLFAGLTAPMRRDPRFIALAAKLGLVDYWRASGHWPDFCKGPGLPYDCKDEAIRVGGPARAAR